MGTSSRSISPGASREDRDHRQRSRRQGGSGRSSALVRMHYSFPAEVQLALVSLHMFQHWRDAWAIPEIFARLDLCELFIPTKQNG